MRSNTPALQKSAECPSWCTANHLAALHIHEERTYKIRGHYGREKSMVARDEFGAEMTTSVALAQVDYLDDNTRGPVQVTALCEGVLTAEQAEQFAAMVLDAGAAARTANLATLEVAR